jgi:hypothetical protein
MLMAQNHPREFLSTAEALAGLSVPLSTGAVAAVDQARAAQRDLMAKAGQRPPVRRTTATPPQTEFLALTIACLEARAARTLAHCSHLQSTFDLVSVRVDLTTGWVSCGCPEQIARPRRPDGLCNLCARPPETLFYETLLTVGPLQTYRADLCSDCWNWISPLYAG